MPPKTVCPISRQDFASHAKPVEIIINGETMHVPVKQFSTGSFGWYLNKRIEIKVGDKPVLVQIGMNMTIVGSKDLPKPPGEEHAPPATHETHAGHKTPDGQEGHGHAAPPHAE
jgi:hypothetical protein